MILLSEWWHKAFSIYQKLVELLILLLQASKIKFLTFSKQLCYFLTEKTDILLLSFY